MPANFQELLAIAQGWCYPAILNDLADHLGVSVDSLQRLGIGWLPVSEPDALPDPDKGRFIIPERDAEGRVIGLGTRLPPRACGPSIKKNKSCYPGSKRGLIYEVNPLHEAGTGGYNAGPANWARALDAHTLCPICGKPDGCLLSKDNPQDPKAVVCIRVESPRRLKLGWLHIRKEEGRIEGARALAVGANPVVAHVEGFSDVAAALDLGFCAVGRPSNVGGLDLLADLVRGIPSLIVGENDEAGKQGGNATLATLQKAGCEVGFIYPPGQFKDLRAWKNNTGLTPDAFKRYIKDTQKTELDAGYIGSDDPTEIIEHYLKAPVNRYNNVSRLRRWGQHWYEYKPEEGRYVLTPDEHMTPGLREWLSGRQVMRITARGAQMPAPIPATGTVMSSLTKALQDKTQCRAAELPTWVNSIRPEIGWENPANILAFKNGLLNVGLYTQYMSGAVTNWGSVWQKPTAELFTTTGLPIEFDAEATCPVWTAFLNSSLDDDMDKILLLQEWFGYCLTPDRSKDKMMYLKGVSGSGKGTILTGLKHMVGAHQAVVTTMADIASHFGLAGWVGKLVATIEDARTPKSADMMRGLERLLNISGGDAVRIERKNKEALEFIQLTSRLTIASNEWLVVPDHAQALPRRTLLITFNRSFVGHEDYDLKDKKIKNPRELTGIVNWALEGLVRLRKQGRFTEPRSSRDAMSEWLYVLNPTVAFVHECCILNGEYISDKNEVFAAWDKWAYERGQSRCMKNQFYGRLLGNTPSVSSCSMETARGTVDQFKGIRLQPWARRQYLGDLT